MATNQSIATQTITYEEARQNGYEVTEAHALDTLLLACADAFEDWNGHLQAAVLRDMVAELPGFLREIADNPWRSGQVKSVRKTQRQLATIYKNHNAA